MLLTTHFVERRSFRGYPYWVLEDVNVARIEDNFLDCVLYMYKSREDAISGRAKGGSGFLVGIKSAAHSDMSFVYAVSNRHVVQNGSLFIRLNTKEEVIDVLDTTIAQWRFTDNQDIAVCPLALSGNHKIRLVLDATFITKEIVSAENIGPGDDIFLVGRFMNHEGKQCNTPTVRFGHVSMMPRDPVGHSTNFSGTQESFLGDVHAISGFSGSPVFVAGSAMRQMPVGKASVLQFRQPAPVWLLGVEWGYLNQDDPEWGPIAKGVKENSGMTAIVPAWRLRELLDIEELQNIRKAEDDKISIERSKAGTTLT
jgi:hypothetical protein